MCNAHLQFSAHGTFHSLTLSQKMGVRHRRDGTWSRFLSDSLAPVLPLSSQPSATCYGLTRPVYFVLALRSLCQTQLPSLSHGPPALNSSGTGRRGPGGICANLVHPQLLLCQALSNCATDWMESGKQSSLWVPNICSCLYLPCVPKRGYYGNLYVSCQFSADNISSLSAAI